MATIDNNVLDDPLIFDGNAVMSAGQYSSVPKQTIPENGFYSAQNMDFDVQGRLVTRRGAMSAVGNVITENWEDMTTNWESVTKFWGTTLPSGTIHAVFYFDTYAAEYVVAAITAGATKSLYYGTPTTAFAEITGSSFTQESVYFAQLNNRLYYCDGDIALKYVDSSVANQAITAGVVSSIRITSPGYGYTSVPAITFSSGAATATALLGYGGRVVSATVTAGGTGYSATTPPTLSISAAPAGGQNATAVPNITQTPSKAKYLTSHTNRLFCTSADTAIPPDTLYASDLLDGTSWDLVGGAIRVGGDGDPITGIFSWFGNNLLVFKQRSIWAVETDPLLTADRWVIRLVNNRVGCVSNRSIQSVGSDVLFLARDGVRSLGQIQSGSQTDVGVPLSTPVQDIIDDIDLNYSALINSCYYKNRYMLAVVVNGQTQPTKTLVWNQMFRSWCGVWTGWKPRDFIVTAFSGEIRLMFAENTGRIWMWDDATTVADESGSQYKDDTTDYESYVITRAYDHREPLVKKQGYVVQIDTENRLNGDTVTAYAYYDLDQSGTFNALNTSISLAPLTYEKPLAWNLISKAKYRTIQFKFGTTAKKIALNNISVAAFPDNIIPTLT